MSNGTEFFKAQRMLAEGRAQCRGVCNGRVLPVEELVTLYYQKSLIIAICPDCFEKVDLIASMKPEGLAFSLKRKSAIIL